MDIYKVSVTFGEIKSRYLLPFHPFLHSPFLSFLPFPFFHLFSSPSSSSYHTLLHFRVLYEFEEDAQQGLHRTAEPMLEITCKTFEVILDFIYTGHIVLDFENIQDILQASDLLLMTELKVSSYCSMISCEAPFPVALFFVLCDVELDIKFQC